MQSKLPDINAAIVRHRSFALDALRQDNMYHAAIGLNSINALLPEDYRVEVNTTKYYAAIQSNTVIVCPSCNTEQEFGNVKVFEFVRPFIDQCVTGVKRDKAWYCSKCKKINKVSQSKINTTKFQEPFFTKIMPEPPKMRLGIRHRVGYIDKFKVWFSIALEELENQIGMYRADYQAQQNGLEQPEFDEVETD